MKSLFAKLFARKDSPLNQSSDADLVDVKTQEIVQQLLIALQQKTFLRVDSLTNLFTGICRALAQKKISLSSEEKDISFTHELDLNVSIATHLYGDPHVDIVQARVVRDSDSISLLLFEKGKISSSNVLYAQSQFNLTGPLVVEGIVVDSSAGRRIVSIPTYLVGR